MGVWIETICRTHILLSLPSPPTWGCGLKLWAHLVADGERLVTPHVGVWIETALTWSMVCPCKSPPTWGCGLKPCTPWCRFQDRGRSPPTWGCGLKHGLLDWFRVSYPSPPTWGCGLKLVTPLAHLFGVGHPPRGGVD